MELLEYDKIICLYIKVNVLFQLQYRDQYLRTSFLAVIVLDLQQFIYVNRAHEQFTKNQVFEKIVFNANVKKRINGNIPYSAINLIISIRSMNMN